MSTITAYSRSKSILKYSRSIYSVFSCLAVLTNMIIMYKPKPKLSSFFSSMEDSYWHIGKRIVEEEQDGDIRAEYGTQLIRTLSKELTAVIGKGFTERNLRNFRKFYQLFPDYEIWHTKVSNLTWSHFRTLLPVENRDARYWS